MIKLNRVQLHNFISVKDLTVTLNDKGLCLIRGRNGTGKSNIFKKSVVYALFGIVPEKMRQDHYILNGSSGGMHVKLDLNVNDDAVVIERYREDSEYGNKIRLIVNCKDISTPDNRKTQRLINELLGVDYSIFMNSTMFSSGTTMFAEEGSTGRGKLLSNILGLQHYAVALANVTSEVALVTEELNSLDRRILSMQESITNDTETLSRLRRERDEYNRTRESKLSELIKRAEQIRSKLRGQSADTGIVTSKLQSLRSDYYECNRLLKSLTKELAKAEADLSSTESEICVQSDKIKKLKVSGVCPTCQQQITRSRSVQIIKMLTDKLSSLRENSTKLSELKVKLQKRILRVGGENEHLESVIADLEKEATKLALQSQEIKHIEDNIASLKESANVYDDSISSLDSAIKSRRAKLGELAKSYDMYNDKLKYLEFWKDGFGRHGIPNLLIERSLGTIGESANKYLSGTGISVELLAQKKLKSSKEVREEIDIVLTVNGEEREYRQLSSGEKRRVDIALLFSILDLSVNKFNILVLDEVFDISLDEGGCELVMNILREKSQYVDSLFVISHKEELVDKFDNVIVIDKCGNESYIRS